MVRQGDVFWLDVGEPEGSEPGYLRPYVVVQNDFFNQKSIRTTVVCMITTNLRHAQDSSNVLLEIGEGGLKKQSVVVTSQILTVNKTDLEEYIGTLPAQRIRQIINGMDEWLRIRDVDEKEGS